MMKKIPVVKQRDIKDCGPACILSILQYYDGYVPLESIRSDCYTDISGTTAYHMVSALKKYGFDSYGAKLEDNNLNTSDLVLPLIAHLILKNGLSHYVVIYKITSKHVLIMDPAKGIVKMDSKEFLEIFDNVVIVCYLKSTYIASYDRISLTSFVLKILKENQNLVIKIFLLGILSVILTIVSGFYFKVLFNNLDDKSFLKIMMATFFFIYLSKSLLEYLSSYLKNYLIKEIDYSINKEFFTKLFNLPSRVVKSRSVGEIVTRVSELNNLHEIISDVVVTLFINILLATLSFIILDFISFTLLKILLIFAVIFIIICIVTNKLIYKMIRKNIESNEIFNNVVIENCNAFDTIKNNSLEKYFLEKIDNSLIDYLKSNFDILKSMNVITTIKNLSIDLMYFMIITMGIILFLNDKLTLVDFITFEAVLVYLIDPIRNIMNIFPKFNYLKASLEKIVEFISLKSEDLDDYSKFINGDITISNMSYSYNDYNNVLSNINLKIKKNSNVMIKGKSGIGKSTFCKLLNRTYEYSTGSIKICDIDIKDYPIKTIRSNILYLSQNEFLLSDTIKNNVILDKKYDNYKFNTIAKICFLDNIVSKKPLRYETVIDKDFSNLSGGEKQRIILARTLYQNFKILILDEALSEVNIILEKHIIRNLIDFIPNKTLIYVTHKNHEELFDDVLTIGDNNENV